MNLCGILEPVLEQLGREGESERREARRLFHGRGHAFPGYEHVCIDWLPPVALITLYAEAPEEQLRPLVAALAEGLPACRSVQVQARYERMGPVSVVWGEPLEHFEVLESGLKYQIQLGLNRNTGLFLDMRNGRDWVRGNAEGKSVLNLFSYTCGFSVAAIEGGAKGVVNVDMSSPALSIGRDNHRLNDHALDSIRFEKLDIFKSFGRLAKRGPYDLLICDPPTLQKGSVNIARDYPKILRRLDRLMRPKSDLLLCLNAPELESDYLLDAVDEYAPQFRFMEQLENPEAFMEAQGKGLKVMHFQHR